MSHMVLLTHVYSGTLPHFLCAGFGAACEVAAQEMQRDAVWIRYLSDRMLNAVMSRIPEVSCTQYCTCAPRTVIAAE